MTTLSPGGTPVPPGAPVLELRDVWAGYGETTVLRGVDITVPRSSVVAVLGPNGAGKSTLLRAASGLIKVRRGALSVDGDDVTGASPSDLVKRGLCHIPDPRGIFRSLTVEENLTLQAPRGKGRESIEKAVDVFHITQAGDKLSDAAQHALTADLQRMLEGTDEAY